MLALPTSSFFPLGPRGREGTEGFASSKSTVRIRGREKRRDGGKGAPMNGYSGSGETLSISSLPDSYDSLQNGPAALGSAPAN